MPTRALLVQDTLQVYFRLVKTGADHNLFTPFFKVSKYM